MKLTDNITAIKNIKDAFNSRGLTIYLGAGVSVASGLPTWEQLVLLLYFRTLKDDISRVYPNYLLAISEWLLKNTKEPLDILVRKVKKYSWNEDEFLKLIHESLYSGFFAHGIWYRPEVGQNVSLAAIINYLCSNSKPLNVGLKSVITYNYDNLLEMGLQSKGIIDDYQVISRTDTIMDTNKIPIYHVHGFIPYEGKGSSMNEMIFSEEQYNNVFQDAYFWGNMVQMQNLTSNTGLMIGISLNDRNIRRILDSIRKSPISTRNYLLLQRATFEILTKPDEETRWIHEQALKYKLKFAGSGVKVEEKEFDQIVNILEQIRQFESETFNRIYEDMGIEVLWYDKHEEVADFIKALT